MGVEILVLAVAIGFGVWAITRSQTTTDGLAHESGEEVLRRRFASGEIDVEEYERRLGVLHSSRA